MIDRLVRQHERLSLGWELYHGTTVLGELYLAYYGVASGGTLQVVVRR